MRKWKEAAEEMKGKRIKKEKMRKKRLRCVCVCVERETCEGFKGSLFYHIPIERGVADIIVAWG